MWEKMTNQISELTALVVDDDIAIANVLVRILNREAIKADILLTTGEGLERLDTTPYNLVFTDLNQVPDGTQVYQKAIEKGSKAFIMTGGTPTEGLMERAMQIAGDDLIMKPFTVNEILDRIRMYKSEFQEN